MFPVIDQMVKVSNQVIAMDVPSQDVISKDNVTMKVNAVVYFRVSDARKAIVEVQDYLYATSQLAQTSLRSIIGENDLDDILAKREHLNDRLRKVLDESTDSWGIQVNMVEVKHIDLPENMQRAMARQAEAERDRRAKIIASQGEYQAAEKLSMAADIMGENPVTIQLRYLQTLTEIAGEKNSTTIFPIPIELIKHFLTASKDR